MSCLLRSGSFLIIGGGTCVWPFLNRFSASKKTETAVSSHISTGEASRTQSTSSDSPPKSPAQQHTPPTRETVNIRELDNCLFKNGQNDITSKFPSPTTRYISFSCDNRGKREEKITSNWTIWFPVTFLKLGEETFKDNQRIDIKTHTTYITDYSESGDYYTTKFTSNIFSHNSITGTWGGMSNIFEYVYSDNDVDASIYKVTIIDPKLENQLIYLRLK